MGLQPGHGGVVSEGRVPDLQQAQALQGSQHDPHGGAVGENGHRLAVMLPFLMLDRFGDGLLEVLFGFKSPREAFEAVEGKK